MALELLKDTKPISNFQDKRLHCVKIGCTLCPVVVDDPVMQAFEQIQHILLVLARQLTMAASRNLPGKIVEYDC